MNDNSYSIFHIEGGLGKHIAATAVAKAIKKSNTERKLIVVCSYPELYINLDFVYRVYRHGNTPYFYQDYIKNKDFILFKHEPYFTENHIKKKTSLIENWCNLYNIEYHGELPEIKFNFRQIQYNNAIWYRDKPIFCIHTNGGPLKEQPYKYSWTRDIPHYLYEDVINYFKDSHHIIQVCRNNDQGIIHPSVEIVSKNMSNMELFGLINASDKRLLIDSSLQHAAAALNKPSTVLWIGTDPIIFGYESNINIKANINDEDFKLHDSYLFDYDFVGKLYECPIINPNTMFNINEILNTF